MTNPTRIHTPESPKKKVFLQTFGCQMNERDSETVKGRLLDQGYDLTSSMQDAQVILLNTCSVRQHAEDRILGRSGLLSRIKRQSPQTVIGMLGCMAQEHGAKFFKRFPSLDLICGPGNLSDLPQILNRIFDGEKKIAATDHIDDLNYTMDRIGYRDDSVKALVNIMSGCDHRCTYCIVPKTRGIERSRPSEDIVREVRQLVSRGYQDVMLLGQNVNCYGKKLAEGIDFTDLLRRIDQTGIKRLRFITSHPKDAHGKLFHAMADLESVCEHLHLPVQSGSSRILKRMKREHTRENYVDRIRQYRRILPQGSLSTDIIVGFPGESEEDFQMTKSLLEEVRYDFAYIFKYSPRPGTPAMRLEDDVPEKTKHRRLRELQELQRSIAFDIYSKCMGHTAEVLFEGRARKMSSHVVGRRRDFKRVVVHSKDDLVGRIMDVRITQVLNETLIGQIDDKSNSHR